MNASCMPIQGQRFKRFQSYWHSVPMPDDVRKLVLNASKPLACVGMSTYRGNKSIFFRV